MALARTNQIASHSAGQIAANTFTTGAFTPPDNSLLVVNFAIQEANAATDTMTVSSSPSLTWTKRVDIGTSGFNHRSSQWTAPVGTGASTTVTVGTSTTGANNEFDVHVFAYTGYNTSTPTGATASSLVTVSGPQSITLSGAPATTSEVVAFANVDTGGGTVVVVAGTGWSEQFNDTDTANLNAQSQTRTASTSTDVHWNNTGSTDGTLSAVEILAAAAAAVSASTLPLMGVG